MKFAELRGVVRADRAGRRAGVAPAAGAAPARELRGVLATQRVARRDRQRIVRRRLVAGGLAGLALVGAIVVVDAWLPRAGLFPLAAVDVRIAPSRHHVTRDAILALAGVRTGTPLLALDLGAIADRVGRHPWVAAVAVRRELPARLVIEVEERRPAAVVQLDRLYFADQAGRLFKPVERGEETDVPVVTGLTVEQLAADPRGVAARLVEGLALVETAAARLGLAVSELHLDPLHGFVLRTRARASGNAAGRADGSAAAAPGLTVVVGEGPFGPKLDRLERVLSHLAGRGVVAESIDLTLGSRAVVRLRALPSGAAAEPLITPGGHPTALRAAGTPAGDPAERGSVGVPAGSVPRGPRRVGSTEVPGKRRGGPAEMAPWGGAGGPTATRPAQAPDGLAVAGRAERLTNT